MKEMITILSFSITLGIFLCSPVGTTPLNADVTNPLNGNQTAVSNFTENSSRNESRYTVDYARNLNSIRRPDRKTYNFTIHDNVKNLNYTVGGGEIVAFNEGHGEGVYSFVKDDNVYYISSLEEEPLQITNGSGIIHGRWQLVNGVGEGMAGNMWLSPSDKYLAFTSRPDNLSQKMMITTFERGNVYDYNYNMDYLKEGENNSADVSISIWSKNVNKSITIGSQFKDNSSAHYLLAASWVVLHGKELLATTWANRWQNETAISLCDYEKMACSLIYEHKYKHGQWASEEDYKNIAYSNDSIFVLLPEAIGANAWQHVSKLEMTSDFNLKTISFVPSGEYDILKIVKYRQEEDLILYVAQAPHPWNQHTYGAPAGSRSPINDDRCLTCAFSNCSYQFGTPTISPSEDLKIDFTCYGPGQRFESTIAFNQTLHSKEISITTKAPAKEYQSEWKIEKFPLSSGYEAIVKIFERNTSLDSVPVTLIVYGGPSNNVNEATDKFENHSVYDHAVVHIDVRGSGGRGWKYRSAIYGRLVTVEVEDTLEAMKIVLDKYPRLDKSRVGVRGWSYGGTMTAALVELAPDGFFKCAHVGAPVTNFIYYAAEYTERYMGDAPLSSYTDLTQNVTKFKHTNLLLVHGLRDENVHFQNSALLIEALQQENIQFELMVYPNQDHHIFGEHKEELVKKFFATCYA